MKKRDEKRSARMKALWQDPEVRAYRLARLKAYNSSPKGKAKAKARLEAVLLDPEVEAKRRAAISAAWDRKRGFEIPAEIKPEWRWMLNKTGMTSRELAETYGIIPRAE